MEHEAKLHSPICSTFEAHWLCNMWSGSYTRIMLTTEPVHSGVSAPQLEREAHTLQRKMPRVLK